MKYSVEYSKAAVRDLDRVWSEVFRASRSYDITERYLNDLMDIIPCPVPHFITRTVLQVIILLFLKNILHSIVWKANEFLSTESCSEEATIYGFCS